MEADIHTLFKSDFYTILDFHCRCKDCSESKPEYNKAFSISFVRKGNFLFNVFRHSLDSYTGSIIVSKPGYERTVTHTHTIPDECTIIDFTNAFYRELLQRYPGTKFLASNDLHSTLLRIDAETEFLHHMLLRLVQAPSKNKLQIDQLVLEIVYTVLRSVTDYSPNGRIHSRLKRNHLTTIERAKEYISKNFAEDISLMEIADHCHVSPFHFSRIFKTFTSASPYQFLLSTRLKHAEILISNSSLPVTEVAFSSGFNSLEHFISAFRQKYNCSPTTFRTEYKADFFQ